MAKDSIGQKLEITPTLVIGLGGTGLKVLSLFKKKIQLLCGPDAPVGFLGIDTDDERLPGAQLTNDEFMCCDCQHAPDVIRNINLYPDIERWWFEGMEPGSIWKGAKMKRPVGRLACYKNYIDKIQIPLNRHIRRLTEQYSPDDSKRLPYNIRQSTIRIYIVGSMSGGTGGGFFYDMAIAVRHAMQSVAGYNLQVSLAGIIVQPGGFVDLVPMAWQRNKVRANFFAGLREIEHLQKHYEDVKKSDTPLYMTLGKVPVVLKTAPFDWIYLVDTVNEKAQNISMSQLWSMIASNLCLEVYSSITNQVKETIMANVTPVTPYASFSLASLSVPVNEILEYCSLRCAKEVLEEKVSHSRPETSESDEVVKFMTSNGLLQGEDETISEQMIAAVRKGRKTRVEESVPRENAGESVFVATSEMKELESEKKGLTAALNSFSQLGMEKAEAVEKAAKDRVNAMLSDASNAYGVRFMVQFCLLLEKKCIAICDELNRQIAGIDLAGLRGCLDPAMEELRNTVNDRGGWILSMVDRGKSAQRCYENWAITVNKWADASLKRNALVQAVRSFQRLQEVSTRLKSSLKTIAGQIDRASGDCLDSAEKVASRLNDSAGQHVLVTNLIGKDQVAQIFEKMHDQIDLQKFVLMLKTDRAVDWVNVRIDDLDGVLEKELLPAIREALKPHVAKLDVFTVADEYWGHSIAEWIKGALLQCSPFCNWNRAVVPDNVIAMTYVGVENANKRKAALGDIDTNKVKIASTGDPYEIVIHSMTAGYPASAVNGLGPDQESRFHYERYCKMAKENPNEHVHVDRRWFDSEGNPSMSQIE